ncbi:MAG: TVP38/TMEM64 family protein [Acutalibacteraceae bacterium]|nr:TVP38/TMEM64 family protein [Clostridiales bacterium]
MKKRYKFWFGAVAALVVLIALLLVLQLLRMDVNAFAERYKNSLWTIPIVVFLYLLKAVTMVFLPQPLVYLITGLLFSPLVAFLVTVGGLSLEFTLDYFLGRRFGSRLLLPLLDRLRGRSRTLDRVLQSDTLDNFGTIALLRLMPGLATDPVSFIAGANKVRFRPFFIASMVGCAPQAIAVTLMGSAVQDPLSPQFLIPAGALVIVLVIAMFVQRKFGKKEKREKTKEE